MSRATYKERWLDVGCGGGEWTREMAGNNPDYLIVGVDMKQYPEWDDENPPNVKYKVADARNLPFEDDYFDHVHANNLGPFSAEVVSQIARELQRVLKEGTASFSISAGTHHGEWKK